ncbi:MAG: hypothetical protein ACXVDD_13365 [Polyangia bacterium]
MKRPHALMVLSGCIVAGVVVGARPAFAASAGANSVDERAAGVIDCLREAGITAQRRADTIAAVPSLPYAVATDQQTMLDMTADELSFHAQPGEIVEVGQRWLRSGKLVSLRREGAGALVHLPLEQAGLHYVIAGDEIYAVAVLEVQPRDRDKTLRGVVGVARLVDVAGARAGIAKLGGAVEIRVGQDRLMVGVAPAGGTTTIVHPPLGAQKEPALAVILPASHRPIGAAMMLAGAGLGLLLLLRRRRHAADSGGYRPGPGTPAATR